MSRVLVTDDNGGALRAIAPALEDQLHVKFEWCEGAKVASKISDADYEAVISEMKLRDLDGLALLKEIRTINSHIPVILLSTKESRNVLADVLRAGAFDFIQCPLTLDNLSVCLTRAMSYNQTLREIRIKQQMNEGRAAELEQLAGLRSAIAVHLATGDTLRVILQKCAEAIVQHLNVAFARIWTLDEGSDTLILQASAGIYTHINGAHGRVKVGDFKIGRIAKNKTPHLSNTVTTDPEVGDKEWAKREGMVAFAGYPLMLESSVVGVMALFSRRILSRGVLDELGSIGDGITQWIKRKQVEEKLEERKEWLRVTLASIGDAVIATDKNGIVNFVNPVAQRLLATTEEKILYQPLAQHFRAIVQSTRSAAENPIARVLREANFVGFTDNTSLLCANETEIPIENSAAPIRDSSGNLIGAVMVFRDITERRRAEAQLLSSRDELERRVKERTEQLREREEHFRVLVEGVTDYAISRLDTNGQVIAWNLGAEKITGFSAEEILGKSFSVFYAPEERAAGMPERDLKEAKDTGRHEREGLRVRKDGSRYWANVMLSALRDEKMENVGFALVARDVTVLRQAELDRQQLVEDVKRKNKDLESVIYVTSHDLRSPLVNIQGYSKELERACAEISAAIRLPSRSADEDNQLQKTLEGDVPKYVRYVLASTEKMNSLLKGLLKLSRLDRHELNILRLDMNTMLSSIVDAMRFQIDEAKARLTVADLLVCYGDESQVNQIFSNLIDNALKYVDSARIPTIQITSVAVNEREAVYCVADNGIGIHPEHQKKIFEIFQRLDPKGKVLGEGLGLTLVQRIVERHGGRIWVESEVGVGSKFFVTLPRYDREKPLENLRRS